MGTEHRQLLFETVSTVVIGLILFSCVESEGVSSSSNGDVTSSTDSEGNAIPLAEVGTDSGGDTLPDSSEASSESGTEPVVLERIPHPLSTNENHTCRIDAEGDVWCFGNNDSGQLGNGDNHASFEPVRVEGLGEPAVSVAAGGFHTCTLLSSGRVMCWGGNHFGQLGQETRCDVPPNNNCESWVPLEVPSLADDIVSIGAGHAHTCAVAVDGGVQCWGMNWHGQLGIGPVEPESYESVTTPTAVVNLGRGARAVALGVWHTCAILVDGAVACWGWNVDYQLGVADCDSCSIGEPRAVFIGDAVSIDTGQSHTCIATAEGDVYCFGESSYGEAGMRPTAAAWVKTPTRLEGVTRSVNQVTLGDGFTCLLEEEGAVRCFGNGRYGQAGTGSVLDEVSLEDNVSLDGAAVAVEAGERHVCALLSSGSVQCWGENRWGQLGDGSGGRPVPMALNTDAEAVFAGFNTCAKTVDGEIHCTGIVGLAEETEDGSFDYTTSNTPVLMAHLPESVVSIKEGLDHTCVMTDDSAVCCFGDNGESQVGLDAVAYQETCSPVADLLPNTAMIAAGGVMSLALSDTGQIQYWGEYDWDYYVGDLGEVGHVVTDPRPPELAQDMADAVSIAAGQDFSCAILSDGALRCAEHRAEELRFVDVAGLPSELTAVAVGGGHACVIDSEGEVWCFGDNGLGQLGNRDSCAGTEEGCPDWWFPDVPVTQVEIPDSPVVALSSGRRHSCALNASGAVYCWGSNSLGQVGLGPSYGRETWPVPVPSLERDVVEISCGLEHTCARKADGAVYCFGDNGDGELGNGHFSHSAVPVTVVSPP